MASVSSLDQDMRRLRMDRYTPGAANEVRRWIEETLGERLPAGDLMEVLKDGVALCRLINLAVSPGVKYKASQMPFVQMENISHFLKACEMPPLSLPSHDRFLTVDLFDQKDPAQVLQCLAAFSRRANVVNPSSFPNTIGGVKGGTGKTSMSPQATGASSDSSHTKSPSYVINTPPKIEPATTFNPLNKAAYSGRMSPNRLSNSSNGPTSSLSRGGLATGGPVSSWSKSTDEDRTAPAWNIHQYGYMGGANQGNQGVAFGARRQITSPSPHVPSIAEKEKRLKEEAERRRLEEQGADQRRRVETELEETRAKEDEERRWAEETRRMREQEEFERQKKDEENERRARNEKSAREEQDRESAMRAKRDQQRQVSDSRLNGQFLSQYNSQQSSKPTLTQTPAPPIAKQSTAESERIAELERQLAEMKEAERRRERLEQERKQEETARAAATEFTKPSLPTRAEISHQDDWDASERDFLKQQWKMQQNLESESRPRNQNQQRNTSPPPAPQPSHVEPAAQPTTTTTTQSTRPLPDPTTYIPNITRTDRYLTTNPAPTTQLPNQHHNTDYKGSTTSEQDLETHRRIQSQTKTKQGQWASKSLLEREMERERERQREWEENQKEVSTRTKPDGDDGTAGTGPGQSWDVNQYGFMGGDSQNRGGPGLGVGGARRQIIGPRPLP